MDKKLKQRERDKLLNDIYFQVNTQANLAKKYNKTPSYVSQMAKSLKQLENHPTVKDNKLICTHCQKTGVNLVFHHNHKTNVLIALVCQSCNLRLRNKDLSGEEIYGDEFKNIGTKDGYRKCSIDISLEHYKLLKEEADKEGISFSDLFRRILKIFAEG